MNKKHNHDELLAWALINGARWEPFNGSKESGEFCYRGLRYSCEIDSRGLPKLWSFVLDKIAEVKGAAK